MKTLNNKHCNVEVLSKQEMQSISGGQVMDYVSPVWNPQNHHNEIYYAMEAATNAGIYVYNGVAWCVNGVASWFD